MNFDIWIIFEISQQYSNFIRIWPECPVLHMKAAVCLWLYLTELFLELETFKKKYLENQNIYFIFNNFFIYNRAVYQTMLQNIQYNR